MTQPQTETEVCEAVRAARAPLSVQGGGTRRIGPRAGDILHKGDILHTGGLAGITLYEPAALTLVARAGTPLADIDALLLGERQRLGFEPPDYRALLGRSGQSTIGGVVAANAVGPRGVQLGACRDALLGVRFVDGRGAAISSGGRVMKNVTGYDLVKLMAGSCGALGVLTEVSLKVQSIPEAEVTLVFEGLDAGAGLALLRRAMGTPFDISGAARAGGCSYLRIEGMAGSVAYRAEKLRELDAARSVMGAQSQAIWQGLRDGAALAGRAGDLWRIVTLPSHAAALMETALAPTGGDINSDVIFDHSGAKILALLPEGADAELHTALADKGQATKLRGANAAPFAAQSAEVAALQSALKAQFDPFGRFSQGVI